MSRQTQNKPISYAITPSVCVSVLGMVILSCVAAYMYFLSMSVVHVVFRKEVNQTARELESEIAALESKYIEAQHAVSERIASAEQLSETNEKIFITRNADTLVLSRTGRSN